MMKPLTLAIALGLFCAVVLVGDGGAPAHASCNPNRVDDDQKYFAGWRRTPGGTAGGVYARIKIYDPYIYPGTLYNNRVSNWVMLSRSDASNWAQIGWKKLQQFRYGFTQWTDVWGGLHDWLYGPPPNDTPPTPGYYHYYTVLYDNYSPGTFTFYDMFWNEGVNYLKGIVEPQYHGGWVPNRVELFGETSSRASQMPGGVSNTVWFADSHIWSNGSWGAMDSEPYIQPSWASSIFGALKYNAYNLYIWDKACAS